MARLGSEYGGWWFVDGPDLIDSKIVLCGAGEDLTFDLAMQQRFHCDVLIVDPTPRAIAHFDRVMKALGDKGSSDPVETCRAPEVDRAKLRIAPVAVWNEATTLKFWLPPNPSHVSCSALNIQQSTEFIKVPAQTLKQVISEAGWSPDAIAMLKLDVEGAEAEALDQMVRDRIFPRQILVEFDELNLPSDKSSDRIFSTVGLLQQNGYTLVHYDGAANCVFVRGTVS